MHIQVLDSLDMEGSMDTNQDALSSCLRPVDGCPNGKASYWLDIQGESHLGYPDDTWPMG